MQVGPKEGPMASGNAGSGSRTDGKSAATDSSAVDEVSKGSGETPKTTAQFSEAASPQNTTASLPAEKQNQAQAPSSTKAQNLQQGLSRRKIMADFDQHVQPHFESLKMVDPDIQIGYRGSLARGRKGSHKGNAPFDPNDFDIDAFVVSDKLAAQVRPNSSGFRSGANVPEVKAAQDEITKKLMEDPRYSTMREPVTFRIFSKAEASQLRKNGDPQYFIKRKN
jgi:filamentous hemagglutinin